jgi:hypothetical protein
VPSTTGGEVVDVLQTPSRQWLSRRGAVPAVLLVRFPGGRFSNPPCVFARNGCFTVSVVSCGWPRSRRWRAFAARSVVRDPNRGGVERFYPVRRGPLPPAMWPGVVSADVAPIAAVQFPTSGSACAIRSYRESTWVLGGCVRVRPLAPGVCAVGPVLLCTQRAQPPRAPVCQPGQRSDNKREIPSCRYKI